MSRRRSRRARRRWREGIRELLDYEVLWTLLTVIVIVAVVSTPRIGRVRAYTPGDIAVADVTAPVDLRVQDPVSTERRQQEAAARAGEIYDHDPQAWAPAFSTVNDLFSWGRETRDDYDQIWVALSAATRDQLEEDAASAAGRSLPEGLVRALWQEGFTVAGELRVAGAIKSLLETRRVGRLEPTSGAGAYDVIVRDILTQQENRLEDPSEVLELEQARALLTTTIEEDLDLPESTEERLAALAAELLRPNLTYNSNETQTRRRQAVASVEPAFYVVKRGRRILRAGDEVTEQTILQLQALQQQSSGGRSLASISGTVFLVGLAVVSLWRYVVHYRRRFRYQRVRRLYLLTLVVLVGMVLLTRLSLFVSESVANAVTREPFNVFEAYRYAIPVAAGSMMLLLLVDTQVAWAFSAVYAVVLGTMTQDLGLVVYALVGSFAAIYSMSQYKQRTALVRTGIAIGVVNVAAVLGLALLRQPLPAWTILSFEAACALAGGVIVAMVATVALPPLEHLFESMTDIKLLELSNMNLPLLKELAVAAPGTYHHSVVVGSLAEKGAEAIGVNPLFARVTAYYHDIGKMRQPQYFIENQKEGQQNPHDKLSPHMSALVLVSHVKEGVAYAEEHGLPQPLIDMIPQHHGTRLIAYFYEKAKQNVDPENGEVNPEEFRYPGPKPQSKEAAILMLADGIEATSRTLSDPNPARLRTMIQKSIRDVIDDDDQFIECGLTMMDLSRLADAFLSVLAGMHHQRIDYPSGEKGDEADETDKAEKSRDEVAVSFADEDRDTQLPGQTYH